jgi:diguanylate cyclase (GGDEF)-like protein
MSLISAPVTSEHRFLGILRLDYPLAGFFTQADLRFLVTIADLGAVALENSELFSRVQDLAIRDSLTALYTKGYLLKALTDECDRARLHNEAFSLLMIDIDFFKNYNDKFGHAAGDIVLKRLSAIICESLKGKNAIASRFGGEEFCVILPGIYKTQAFALASSLRQRVENERILLRRQDTGVTLSIGIAAFPEDAQGQTELLYKADQAMYAAKQEGRNRVCSA